MTCNLQEPRRIYGYFGKHNKKKKKKKNMITEAFDNQSPAIINPQIKENVPRVDGCILTFSHVIEKFVF